MSESTTDTSADALEVRAATPVDERALRDFTTRIPDGDRTFLSEDLDDPAVIARWVDTSTNPRWIALHDGAVVGMCSVLRGVGWSQHVGEVRLVVDPTRRRLGIGRALTRRAVMDAVERGMTKLIVEVVADQESTVAMFGALGFEAEGLLRDHVVAGDGRRHDLLVLAHFVEELWASMATTGLDLAIGGAQ